MTDVAVVRRGALPEELTTFVDRRTELVDARARLGTTRLLTILGPGGVGKTRFAGRLASAVRKLYGENVWFFDLSAVAAGGSVLDHVATYLGVQNSGHDQVAEVISFFGDSPALLVLDSCEHVLDNAADLVSRVLDACPGASVIATSQTALRLVTETIFPLDPLSIPGEKVPLDASAVRLFLDRAQRVTGRSSEPDLVDITEICRRLDGIPLAIELAACRMRALSPAQILDRLDAPLGFLANGYRDLPDRQRTLAGTISWSYELCTDEERELWRLMSVFTGGWDLESAERMLAGSQSAPQPLDLVESLIEKSIVRRREAGGGTRYSMFDTVRLFGLEVSSPDERERASEIHRDWCLERLVAIEARWFGPDQREWLRLGRRELPNIRSALEFSIRRSQGDVAAALLVTAWRVVWQANGRFDEFRRWALRVLDVPAPPTAGRCQMVAIVAGIEAAQGDAAAALDRIEQAQKLADRGADPITLSFIEAIRGYAEANLERKIEFIERSLELQGGVNHIVARADIEQRLVSAHDMLGHTQTATAMLDRLMKQSADAGDRYEISLVLMRAGIIATQRSELESGTHLLRQALQLAHDLDTTAVLAQVQEALASVAASEGEFERAATLLGISQAAWGMTGGGTVSFSPLLQRRLDVEAHARRVLGTLGFDTAYRHGQAMSVGDGVAYGLGMPPRTPPPGQTDAPLSPREREVVALVAEGLSDREIAQRLVISPRTAEGHIAKALMKLGFTSRSQIAAWVARSADDQPR